VTRLLQLTVKVGQSITLPGVGTIVVKEKSGRCIKLGFDVPKDQEVRLVPLPGEPERRIESALLVKP
tara:strand:- start:1521 stop:1721 length:201 start_codon:yes stop_codon:yes gene_type:complete